MPPTRSNNQTRTALAVAQQARLERQTTRSSNLTKFLEQDHKPTKRERRIAREAYTRAGAIQVQAILDEWTSEAIDEIYVRHTLQYASTVYRMNQPLYVPVDTVTAKDIAAFVTAAKADYTRHKFELIHATVGNIIDIGGEQLPLEEKPKSLLDKILDWGGDE